MSPASYALALIMLAAGCTLGWFSNKAYSSHGDVKVGKGRVRNYRKSRHHNGVIAIIMALVIGIVVFDLLKPHG